MIFPVLHNGLRKLEMIFPVLHNGLERGKRLALSIITLSLYVLSFQSNNNEETTGRIWIQPL
jgi:hypothetical protein